MKRKSRLFFLISVAILGAGSLPAAAQVVTGGGTGTNFAEKPTGGGVVGPSGGRALCLESNPSTITFQQMGSFTATDGLTSAVYNGPTIATVELPTTYFGPDGTYGDPACSLPSQATATVTGSSGGGGVGAGAGGACTSGPGKAKFSRLNSQFTIEWGGDAANNGDGTCTIKGNSAPADATLTLPPSTLHVLSGETLPCGFDPPGPGGPVPCDPPVHVYQGNYTVTAAGGDPSLPPVGPGPTPPPSPPSPPHLDGISPVSGPKAGGQKVTLTGSALAGAAQVNFGANAVTAHPCSGSGTGAAPCFTADSSGAQITVFTPASPSAQAVNVNVIVPGTGTTNSVSYTYEEPPSTLGGAPPLARIINVDKSAPLSRQLDPPPPPSGSGTVSGSGSPPGQLTAPPPAPPAPPGGTGVQSASIFLPTAQPGPAAAALISASHEESDNAATSAAYSMVRHQGVYPVIVFGMSVSLLIMAWLAAARCQNHVPKAAPRIAY